MKNDYIAIFTTCSSRKEADVIVMSLLKKRLVACGTITGYVASRFRWKGKLDKASEVLVILKTRRANFFMVEREIKRLHSYDVPEIIAFPIVAGSPEYLGWIHDSVV